MLWFLGCPQGYVFGVGVISVISVILEMKNSKNTPLFPPLDAFSKK